MSCALPALMARIHISRRTVIVRMPWCMIHLPTYIYIYICIHRYTHVLIYIYTHIHIRVYIYICIYTSVYIYTHVYHIHIHHLSPKNVGGPSWWECHGACRNPRISDGCTLCRNSTDARGRGRAAYTRKTYNVQNALHKDIYEYVYIYIYIYMYIHVNLIWFWLLWCFDGFCDFAVKEDIGHYKWDAYYKHKTHDCRNYKNTDTNIYIAHPNDRWAKYWPYRDLNTSILYLRETGGSRRPPSGGRPAAGNGQAPGGGRPAGGRDPWLMLPNFGFYSYWELTAETNENLPWLYTYI